MVRPVLTDVGHRLRRDFVTALFTGVPAVAGLTETQRRQLHGLLTKVAARQERPRPDAYPAGFPEP
jgi:hypothetical protein